MTTEQMQNKLESWGFICGKRNPRASTNYSGAFMVIEPHDESELPTKDGRNGPWCIVGDDLGALIREAYEANLGAYGK